MLDILIVEDNKEIGGLLETFLRKENYVVSVADSGEKAIKLFEAYGAKLVILDLMLPGIDGFAVCSKIRETSNAHILIASAKTEKDDKLKGLNLGADDYMRSIPEAMHETVGLKDWSWTDRLIGDDGTLKIAVEDHRKTVEWYKEEFQRYMQNKDIQGAARCEKQLQRFRRSAEDKDGKNDLIEFLARNNVLPKYGFPVDTVELHQGMFADQGKVQMVRDLQLAIAEYAPDAQVVADGKLYTSRYIRKLPQATGQDWKEVFIAQCGNPSCKTWNQRVIEPSQDGEHCISCGNLIEKVRWRKAIEPRKGFTVDPKVTDVPLRKPERSYRSEDYYIGDPTRRVMYKKTFRVFDEEKIRMETSSNDSLMVVCSDHFYVCDNCGYAISSTAGREDKNFNSYALSYEKKHKSPWGKECKGKLYRKDLCHTFKTDVVRITFGTSRAKNQSTMLSVMYALLEAASQVLDIERTDIKGCLHKVRFGRSMIYEVILYDAVAGGAGHVRRLMTDDCGVFQKVIEEAIHITKGCSCSSSCYNCLRNYYNQTIHDMLSRIEAYSFLEHYFGPVTAIPEDQFEEHKAVTERNLDETRVKFSNGYSCTDYQSWNEFSPVMLAEEYMDVFGDMDRYHVPIPSESYCRISVPGTAQSSEALMVWKDQRILVFDNDNEKVDISGWTSLFIDEIDPVEFAQLF